MQGMAHLIISLKIFASSCIGGSSGDVCIQSGTGPGDNFNTGLPTSSANADTLKTVLQLGFGVIGAIAVIYLMYAAFRFVRSQGEPQQIAQARMTILYAVVGLAIALSAELLVTYTLGRI
ncbi:MAG: hypothetical protein ABI221_03670 [Candidatus Saccharimonadales bacterium]